VINHFLFLSLGFITSKVKRYWTDSEKVIQMAQNKLDYLVNAADYPEWFIQNYQDKLFLEKIEPDNISSLLGPNVAPELLMSYCEEHRTLAPVMNRPGIEIIPATNGKITIFFKLKYVISCLFLGNKYPMRKVVDGVPPMYIPLLEKIGIPVLDPAFKTKFPLSLQYALDLNHIRLNMAKAGVDHLTPTEKIRLLQFLCYHVNNDDLLAWPLFEEYTEDGGTRFISIQHFHRCFSSSRSLPPIEGIPILKESSIPIEYFRNVIYSHDSKVTTLLENYWLPKFEDYTHENKIRIMEEVKTLSSWGPLTYGAQNQLKNTACALTQEEQWVLPSTLLDPENDLFRKIFGQDHNSFLHKSMENYRDLFVLLGMQTNWNEKLYVMAANKVIIIS
jgi:hypothetical protein